MRSSRIRRVSVALVAAGVMAMLPLGTAEAGAPYSVSLTASSSSVPVGTPVVLTATANQDVGPTPYYIVILDQDGGVQDYCGYGRTCTHSHTSPNAGTYSYEAVIAYDDGSSVQAYSQRVSVTWTGPTAASPNPSFSSYSVSLSASSTSVAAGSSVTLTARANRDIGPTEYYITILDEFGDIEESCGYGSTCSVSVYSSSPGTRSWYAVIDDYYGENVQATSDWVDVTWGSSQATYSVSLSASSTNVPVGDVVTLTATANRDVGPTEYYIDIYASDGYLERSCAYGSTCSVEVSFDEATSMSYTAYIEDYDEIDVQAQSSSVTITWSGSALPDDSVGTTRIAGVDRFETSTLLSQSEFDPGVPVVYLATGMSFADALAGGAGAAAEGGPVLTTRRDSLPDSVAAELARLQPETVVILGGIAAVSDEVAQRVAEITGTTVTRVAGVNRYATAAAISERVFGAGVSAAYVATGSSFADALSGGIAAAARGGPVLLVESSSVPAETAAELARLDPVNIIVIGDTTNVSDTVLNQIRGYATEGASRISGSTRYDTSAAVSAATFGDRIGRLYLATGESFADALSGVALAGRTASPMLLVQPTCVPASTADEINRLDPAQLVIIGGPGAVGASIETLTPC